MNIEQINIGTTYIVQPCRILDKSKWDDRPFTMQVFKSLARAQRWAKHMRKHPGFGRARIIERKEKIIEQ